MKILFLKLLKNYLFWAFSLLFSLMVIAYVIFKDKETVLAAIGTGLVVMFGYFATHYFTISRNQRERKFQSCLELIKKIRFFILENDINGESQQIKIRDELQDAYFSFSLLTSEKSYKALSKMMSAFEIMLKDNSKLAEFKKAQSYFVNSLRKEFFIDKEINFETYDFRLRQKNHQKI